MYKFNFHRPETLDQVTDLLESCEDPKLLAGGQTLLPTLKQRLASPSDLIDLSLVHDLKGIKQDGDTLSIGAMTKHYDVATSDLVQKNIPGLADLASHIGDNQVRNLGTIGGSIANNDPVADYPAACLGLGAEIQTNLNSYLSDDFFVDMFETKMEEHEVILSVKFPIVLKSSYMKFPNPASRYALVGAFVAQTNEGVRVAVTGAASSVFRATEAEELLSNDFSTEAIESYSCSEEGLNEDIHASAAYRAHLVKIMIKRAVENLL